MNKNEKITLEKLGQLRMSWTNAIDDYKREQYDGLSFAIVSQVTVLWLLDEIERLMLS